MAQVIPVRTLTIFLVKGLLKNNLRKFLTSYMMSFRDKYHGHPDEIQEIVSLDERTISTYLGSN